MKRVTAIGFSIPSFSNDDHIPLDSLGALSDTDIALFSPNLSYTSYSNYDSDSYPSREEFEGKKLYNKKSSADMLLHSQHWRNELTHFIENGGTVFVILSKQEDFFIYTGTTDFTGTGRNRKAAPHVSPFSNYNFLPFKDLEFKVASGKTIVPSSSSVADLFANFKDYLHFEMYIKGDKLNNPTFTTKNKDRVLGVNIKFGKGLVLFIPHLNLEVDKFIKYNSKKDQNDWNEAGIKIGKMLLTNLVEIDKAIRKHVEKSPRPNWIQNEQFLLKSSESTRSLIKEHKVEVTRIEAEIAELRKKFIDQESLKDLLYETGKPLEDAVIKALKILGYQAENYSDGELELDQVIISPEGDRLIGECEGKDNKDIDVTKFRQLLYSLNADFELEHVQEKAFGLLFGNPQRLVDPAERTLAFTKKCCSGAEREKIGLIKTEDLFRVAKYISENQDNDFAKLCRDAIIQQLGKIIQFPRKD
ncbi:hypothetical protein [Dyadobacter sandarakinus]|uniref:Restriction endonuclease n=1 Tax=Dyadobacter sandarakinus TaxID=2747268 RepID=A0ABX7IB92_9BACT|nr:hypothetical protein [Dyadobacter sandarakinus]QRR03083.1 hypothetical protein HWI92_20290 [Dyadobacter sandarakinus]